MAVVVVKAMVVAVTVVVVVVVVVGPFLDIFRLASENYKIDWASL